MTERFSEAAMESLRNCDAALQRGEPSEALALAEAFLSSEPGQELGFFYKGLALHALGRVSEAAGAFRTGGELAPDRARCWFNLGCVNMLDGNPKAAVAAFRAAHEASPSDWALLANWGEAERRLGRLDEALVLFRRAIDANPAAHQAHANLSLLMQARGRLEDARRSLDLALAIVPNSAEYRYLDACLAVEEDRRDAARRALQQTLALDPENRAAKQFVRRLDAQEIPAWHFPMLADKARNAAYQRAIERAVGPKSRVLDIGTGTGLLAMMAARAGAEWVIACEMNSAIAGVAASIVSENGYGDQVKIVAKRSLDLSLGEDMPDKATILVSEIVDVGLLGEGVLPTMRHAVNCLALPGAAVIPCGATVKIQIVQIPHLVDAYPLAEVSGFDVSAFNRFRDPYSYEQMHLHPSQYRALTPPAVLFEFDFSAPPPVLSEVSPLRSQHVMGVVQEGFAHAAMVWFDLHMDDVETVSTGPDGEMTCWGQAVQLLAHPFAVAVGSRLRVEGFATETALWVDVTPS